MDMVRERELNVPIFQKQNLTIEEAAVYSKAERTHGGRTLSVRFVGGEQKAYQAQAI